MHATARKVRRFMRLAAVQDATGLKHTSIYKKVSEGTFPKPIKLGEKAIAWDEDEVAEWQAERIAQRDKALSDAERAAP